MLATPPINKLLMYLVTTLVSLGIAAGGWYGSWINTQLAANKSAIETVMMKHIEEQQNLEILNAKMDLLLHFNKVEYNGPQYTKPHSGQ